MGLMYHDKIINHGFDKRVNDGFDVFDIRFSHGFNVFDILFNHGFDVFDEKFSQHVFDIQFNDGFDVRFSNGFDVFDIHVRFSVGFDISDGFRKSFINCGILGQVWYLIVLIPDLCHLSYFDIRFIWI